MTFDLPYPASRENILILVDFQEGFLRENTDHLRAPVQELVDSGIFRTILATRFVNRPGSLWTEIIGWHGLLSPAEQALAVRLSPGTRVLDKSTYSLSEPVLSELVEKFADCTTYLAGVETDVCVAVIAAQLFDCGIPAVVLADYTASARGAAHQKHALITLSRIIGAGRVVPGHFSKALHAASARLEKS